MKDFQIFMGIVAFQKLLNIKQLLLYIPRQIISQKWKKILNKEKGRIEEVEYNKL